MQIKLHLNIVVFGSWFLWFEIKWGMRLILASQSQINTSTLLMIGGRNLVVYCEFPQLANEVQ